MMIRMKLFLLSILFIGLFGWISLQSVLTHFISTNNFEINISYSHQREIDTVDIVVNSNGNWFTSEESTIKDGNYTFRFKNVPKIQTIKVAFNNKNNIIQINKLNIYRNNESIDLLLNKSVFNPNCATIKYNSDNSIEMVCSPSDPSLFIDFNNQLNLKSYTKSDIIILSIYGIITLLFWFMTYRFLIRKLVEISFSKALFFILFTFILIAPLTTFLLGLESIEIKEEGNKTGNKHELSLTDNIRIFDNTLEDSFFWREDFIHMYSNIHFYGFNESPFRNKVFLGKDNYFFPYLLDQSEERFPDEIHNAIIEKITKKINYFNELGIEYYLLLAPNKQTVYPEMIYPREVINQKIGRSKFTSLINELSKDSLINRRFFSPYASMLEEKKKRDLYYKTDMHWNAFGAFLGYKGMIALIKKNHPTLKYYNFDDFKVNEKKYYDADLSNQLTLENDLPRKCFEFELKEGKNYSIQEIYGQYPAITYRSKSDDSDNELKLLMFRDSYGQELRQFFSSSFSEVVYIWDQDVNTSIITKEKPDIIIQEISEFFIIDLFKKLNRQEGEYQFK